MLENAHEGLFGQFQGIRLVRNEAITETKDRFAMSLHQRNKPLLVARLDTFDLQQVRIHRSMPIAHSGSLRASTASFLSFSFFSGGKTLIIS